MWQQAILRRNAKTDPRPVFLWCDESQNFVSSYDREFQAVARSARACTVYLTQNISNYYSALKNRDETHALLGNFQTKIFHSNGDYTTNQYAADVIAQKETFTIGFNTGSSEGDKQDSDRRSMGSSGSEQMRYKVYPAAFTSLRQGGTANKFKVDAIVFKSGRIWQATDDTFLKVTFKQQG
jgi:hypothetical protein